jgi:hypothetical protein
VVGPTEVCLERRHLHDCYIRCIRPRTACRTGPYQDARDQTTPAAAAPLARRCSHRRARQDGSVPTVTAAGLASSQLQRYRAAVSPLSRRPTPACNWGRSRRALLAGWCLPALRSAEVKKGAANDSSTSCVLHPDGGRADQSR